MHLRSLFYLNFAPFSPVCEAIEVSGVLRGDFTKSPLSGGAGGRAPCRGPGQSPGGFGRSPTYLRGLRMAACAADRRAIGTRKGLQET